MRLLTAARKVRGFQSGGLGARLSMLEYQLVDLKKTGVVHLCGKEGVDTSLLEAGFEVKKLARQVNTLIHAVGILTALPAILRRGDCGRRSLTSVMSRNKQLSQNFYELYPDEFSVVTEYFNYRKDLVQIVDLLPVLPELTDI